MFICPYICIYMYVYMDIYIYIYIFMYTYASSTYNQESIASHIIVCSVTSG